VVVVVVAVAVVVDADVARRLPQLRLPQRNRRRSRHR
jgi:hypothetical protein